MTSPPLLQTLTPTFRYSTIGEVGGPHARLLSGPPRGAGAESLDGHLTRWGVNPLLDRPAEMRTALRSSGLQGRGGGRFPLSMKLETAMLAPGVPVVVVNASESEPASAKDDTLCRLRPHLVLDGAAAVAAMVGAGEATIHLHRSARGAREAIEAAVAERRSLIAGDPWWRVSVGPDRYVSGEASAIASFIDGGEARPRFSQAPMAVRGPSGRPTVVSNAETVAHLALLCRWDVAFWRAGGSLSSPGSQLVTVAGAVAEPGRVFEVVGEVGIGEVLMASGILSPPAAVLVGGYAGTWVQGAVAWSTSFEPAALEQIGAQAGCGLLGVLPHGSCGLAETARVVAYLAGETAGQCGPCVSGLPTLAATMEALARGELRRRELRRLRSLCDRLIGSGACRHPDGVVRLVRSAIEVFEDDVVRHLSGAPCRGASHAPILPIPDLDAASAGWR